MDVDADDEDSDDEDSKKMEALPVETDGGPKEGVGEKPSGEFIEFSDDEDDDDDTETEGDMEMFAPEALAALPKSPAIKHAQGGAAKTSTAAAPPPFPLLGGHCQAVFKMQATTARTKMKAALQQKTRQQSSQSVAQKFGLASADHLVKVLGGIELERWDHAHCNIA